MKDLVELVENKYMFYFTLVEAYGQIRRPAMEVLDSAGAVFAHIVDRHELFLRCTRYMVHVALLLNRFLFTKYMFLHYDILLFILFHFYKKSRTTGYGPRTLWNRN